MIPWVRITSFGDTVVMLPAAAIIAVWLIAGGACRMAVWWCLLFTFGLVLVAATKIAFVGWGISISGLDFTGISGHAMRATAIFPVIFYLALRKSPPLARISGVLLGGMIGVLIGMSRIVLNTHSVSEVIAGCVLGGVIGLGFIRISNRLPKKPFLNPRIIALSLLALLPTSYAEPAPTNQWINAVALYLSGHDTPYVRIRGN
jgi:membrane-associated phospholipid phosphatase